MSAKEVKNVLSDFISDKIHFPGGCPLEFYLHFFYLLGEELTLFVNESRRSWKIPFILNSNFLFRNSKKDGPKTISDYRPISLRNVNVFSNNGYA